MNADVLRYKNGIKNAKNELRKGNLEAAQNEAASARFGAINAAGSSLLGNASRKAQGATKLTSSDLGSIFFPSILLTTNIWNGHQPAGPINAHRYRKAEALLDKIDQLKKVRHQ